MAKKQEFFFILCFIFFMFANLYLMEAASLHLLTTTVLVHYIFVTVVVIFKS